MRQKTETLSEEGKRILELAKQEVERMIINDKLCSQIRHGTIWNKNVITYSQKVMRS